jgi:cytochrome P450
MEKQMSYSISDFKTAGETLRVNELRQALYDAGAILMDKVLVNLHGKEHQMRRKVEAKILKPNFFRWYETEVFQKTLDETITPYLKEGKADLVDLAYRILLNLTADFSGIDRPKRSFEETERILIMLRTFGKAATLGQAKGNKDAISNEIKNSLEAFNKEFYKPSKQKRLEHLKRLKLGDINESDLPRDILTQLLKNQEKLGLSDNIILKETAFYLLAGAFTSIHSLTHAMHEIFERIKDPIQKSKVMSDPIYLQRCIHESMRLHPSSPTAMRRPTCPFHTTEGTVLNKSDTLVIDLMEANRDISVFGLDANDHNPERTLPSGVPPYGLSFGKGMHACIGVNLAAGNLPKEDSDPTTHQFGIITLTAKKLLEFGASPDKNNPGVVDNSTVRNNWSSYPILF